MTTRRLKVGDLVYVSWKQRVYRVLEVDARRFMVRGNHADLWIDDSDTRVRRGLVSFVGLIWLKR